MKCSKCGEYYETHTTLCENCYGLITDDEVFSVGEIATPLNDVTGDPGDVYRDEPSDFIDYARKKHDL